MSTFVGRTEEQTRFAQVLAAVTGPFNDGPDESHVVVVQGYGGIGKSMLLRRFAEMASDHNCGVLEIDWERDRDRHPEDYVSFGGPEIWRILDRIRSAVDMAARSWGWWDRRTASSAFSGFQRQVSKLPELEQQVIRLGLGDQLGHRPLTPEEIADIVKSGTRLANLAGVPAPVTNTVATAAGTAAQMATSAIQGRATRIDAADYRALVDQVDAVVVDFADGLRILARRRPLVLLLDTCELLGGSGPWLREVMRRSGRHVVWVLGTRLEPERVAAGDSEAARFAREIDERRLRVVSLARFDDRTATEFLVQRLNGLPTALDVRRVLNLTQGVPLALDFMSKLVTDQLQSDRDLDSLYDEIASDGTVSSVVQRMAHRYLVHANQRPDSELHRDLESLHALALIHTDQGAPRLRSDDARDPFDLRFDEADGRDDGPVVVARDPSLLAALWDVPVDQVAGKLRELSRRHDFVHSNDGSLHRDVRDAIRLFLLTPAERVRVAAINERAVRYLVAVLEQFSDASVEDRVNDSRWRTTAVALLWHACWLDPDTGMRVLYHLFAPVAVLHVDLAHVLVNVAKVFTPYCPADQAAVDGLAEMVEPLYWRSRPAVNLGAAIGRLATARAPELHGVQRSIVSEPIEPYIELIRAKFGSELKSDVVQQVSALRRVESNVRVLGEGARAEFAHIASSVYVSDVRNQSLEIQRAVLTASEIAARYQPSADMHLQLGNVQFDLDRFVEAARSYRAAISHEPDNAEAHNNLGIAYEEIAHKEEVQAARRRTLRLSPDGESAGDGPDDVQGTWAEAEAAYREALRLDAEHKFAWPGLGNVLMEQGKWTEAEAAYRENLRLDPSLASGASGLGHVLIAQGKWVEAEAAHREALRLDPEHAPSWNGLGNILIMQGKLAEAEAAFRTALRLNPDFRSAGSALGIALLEQARFSEAEAIFCETINRHPDFYRARGWYGRLLLATRRSAQAATELAMADDDAYFALLLWALSGAESAVENATHVPQRVLALLDRTRVEKVVPRSPFAAAEIRALAMAGIGADAPAQLLRSAVTLRTPHDRFFRPLYDLLDRPEFPAVGELLAIWREIIAADPAAAGPCGSPGDEGA